MVNLPQDTHPMTTIRQEFLDGHHIICNSEFVPSPSASLFSASYWQQQGKITGKAKGRGTTLFIKNGEYDWVLRHFRRGGLIGKCLDDQYVFTGVSSSRPFEEFALLTHMRQQGLKVPLPIAASIKRNGLIYRGDLITQAIPNSVDLHHKLTRTALSQHCWRDIGKAMRKMHDCQVYHHDANVRNIMLDDQNQVWLIDFDRCAIKSGHRWKLANISRLHRSLHKEVTKNPQFYWQESDWAFFMQGYSTS